MRKLSVVLIVVLLVSTFMSCGLRNNVDGSDNEGLDDILSPTTGDSEVGTSNRVNWTEDSPSEDSRDETHAIPENVETSYASPIEISTSAEDTKSLYEETTVEIETSVEKDTSNTYDSETEAYVEPPEVNTEPAESSSESAEVVTEPETEEPHDGMEITLSNSKTIINEAYNAGIIASGYSVAKGSGRIIQVYKDNPNLIQVVFETDDPNILVAINYHRVNANSDWKLVNGLPISIIDLTETEE